MHPTRSRLRRVLAVFAAAVAVPVLIIPGTASADTVWGDSTCQYVPEVPDSGIALSGPSVTGLRYGQTVPVSVFGIGGDQQVWYRQIGGAVGSWQPLGGRSLYGPAAVYSGTTSHVLVTGGDGAVWMRSDAGSGWSGWTSLGGYFVTSPAAASLGAGHLRVFGTGADGALWSNEFAGGWWSGWHSLGGGLASAPVATAYPGFGGVEATVIGTDGLTWTVGGLSPGARSGGWARHPYATCSVLAAPSVSTVVFPGYDRHYLNSEGVLSSPRSNGSGTYAPGGHFVASNPDVENVGVDRVVTGGIGDDGAIWIWNGAVGPGFVSLGGRFV
jgi:hypothetical protein